VLRKKILDACDELERLLPLIIQATKDALQNPDDKEAQERLAKLLERARAANKVINDAAEELRATDKKKVTPPPKKEKELSEYRSDGTKDPIMVAAHQVNNASREAMYATPEQKDLFEIAKAVAAEMEQLSLAAQRNSKKDMITAARNIAGMIAKIQSVSSTIADKCGNTLLKTNLLNVSRVPKNFAVQLKIISAVKAVSGENDASAEAQLVICAQGLANSVVQTVKAAEAALVAKK